MSFVLAEPPQTVEWYTPEWIFTMLGLVFFMDPCHPGRHILTWVPALFVYTKLMDGLAARWWGRVWLNPPYGDETPKWLAKMHVHRDGVALVFARTDTKWFHDYVAKADAVLFLKKRVRFVDQHGNPGKSPNCGSMLVAWGEESVAALRRAEAAGHGVLWDIAKKRLRRRVGCGKVILFRGGGSPRPRIRLGC